MESLFQITGQRSKRSLRSLPNEGRFLTVSHFTPISSRIVVSSLPCSCLVGAGELNEFKSVISGKIMGNPWESCWHLTSQPLVRMHRCCSLLSFQLSSKAIKHEEQKEDSLPLTCNKFLGATVEEAVVFYLMKNQI